LLLGAAALLYARAPRNMKLPEEDQAVWSNRAVVAPSWTETAGGRFYDTRRDGYRPAIRPLAVLLHLLEYVVFKDARSGFVWIHVVLAAACAGAFLAALRASGLPVRTALLGALLLVAHPIGCGSVANVAASGELLALLFGLAGFALCRPGGSSLLPAAFLGCAALSHEIGFAFAGAILVRIVTRRGAAVWPVAVLAVVLGYRILVLATLPDHHKIGQAVGSATGLDWPHRFAYGLTGLADFVRTLVAPWRLAYANDHLRFAPALALRAAAGAALLAALITWAYGSIRRRGASADWSVWTLLATAGTTGLVIPATDLIPPRLYLAILPGAIAAILFLASRVGTRWPGPVRAILGTVAAFAIAAPLGVRTVLRVRDYQDWETVVIRQTDAFPSSVQGWFDRGNVALARGSHATALHYYEKATTIWPEHWPSWINIGAAYGDREERGLAMRVYEQVIQRTEGRPPFRVLEARAQLNRAMILLTQARNVEAVRGFENMVEVFPEHVAAHANLGMVYSNSEQMDERASMHLNRAMELETDPDRRRTLQGFLDGIQKRREQLNRRAARGAGAAPWGDAPVLPPGPAAAPETDPPDAEPIGGPSGSGGPR
jgi:tetratricopeptide (TPR) repeat protein